MTTAAVLPDIQQLVQHTDAVMRFAKSVSMNAATAVDRIDAECNQLDDLIMARREAAQEAMQKIAADAETEIAMLQQVQESLVAIRGGFAENVPAELPALNTAKAA